MLKVFRDNLKYLSWVLWLVIAVFILFVFVDFGATVPGGSVASDSAATVGRHKISYAEFERMYRQTEDFYRQTYGEQFNRELAQQMGLPMQVLDGLIADKILLAEALRMGLEVTDEELGRAISGLPAFQLPDGRFIGEERYAQILRSNGYSVEQFERAMRTDLLNDKVRTVLSNNVFIPEAEAIADFRDRNETASIRYLRLSPDDLVDEIAVDDAELQEYYSSHVDDFRVPEQRVVDYLLVDPSELRSAVEVGDGEVRAYYDSQPDEFSQEEQVRARHILLKVGDERTPEGAEEELQQIRRRVESGEDFAALAAELSEDPGSREQGGDLGFFGRGQMISEFEEAAFGAEPGSLVGPIRTSFGLHLIQVLERRPGGRRPFEEVAEAIRGRLLAERSRELAESKARELAERLRDRKPLTTDTLRAVAEAETGVTLHTTSPFASDDNVPGIGRATAFSVSAFAVERDALSAPVQVARGWAILRLESILEPRLPELAEVRDQVREALLEERQRELAWHRLEETRERIAAGSTLDEVAADLDLTVQDSSEIRRLGPVPGLGSNPEIAAAALALEVGELGGPFAHDGGAVLFQVTERRRYDPAEFAQQKEAVLASLRGQRLEQMLSSLIAQRREEMGVRYDTQLLRNFELVPGES